MDLKVLIDRSITLNDINIPAEIVSHASFLEYVGHGNSIAAVNFTYSNRDQMMNYFRLVRDRLDAIFHCIHCTRTLFDEASGTVGEVYRQATPQATAAPQATEAPREMTEAAPQQQVADVYRAPDAYRAPGVYINEERDGRAPERPEDVIRVRDVIGDAAAAAREFRATLPPVVRMPPPAGVTLRVDVDALDNNQVTRTLDQMLGDAGELQAGDVEEGDDDNPDGYIDYEHITEGRPLGYNMRSGVNYDSQRHSVCGVGVINENELAPIIAQIAGGQAASMAKLYSEKRRVYNDLMARVVSVGRELTQLSNSMSSNESVKKVVDSLACMKEKCSEVESYELTKSHIIIKTTELITDEVINGHKRKLGKFAIFINLRGLTGSYESSSSVNDIVQIFNLTRRHSNGGTSWWCGHVTDDGGICFGNMASILVEALVSSDVFSVIDVVLRFIKNPNLRDSWGRHMVCWPWADSEEVVNEVRQEG